MATISAGPVAPAATINADRSSRRRSSSARTKDAAAGQKQATSRHANISRIKFGSVTGDRLATLRQAAGGPGEAAWVGDMSAALECCDRGWLSVAHLANAPVEREGVFYRVTERGVAVLLRQYDRRQVH